jgi:hypothetical protein
MSSKSDRSTLRRARAVDPRAVSGRLDRRMFLRGAAGALLAIPLLPSIFSSDAKAQAFGGPRKRFVALGTEHGGIWQSHMYPAQATLTETSSYAGHAIRRGPLELGSVDGDVGVSQVLRAPSSTFTPGLLAKMNLVRGLDVPFYLAHHRGGHLGNYAENDGNGADGTTLQQQHRPTIDQLLAWSPAFYGSLDTILERSLVLGGGGMSANWSSPSTKTGTVQNLSPENDSLALFSRIFVPPTDPGEQRAPIVDLVREDYLRLRNGNRRLSSDDRRRLDDHVDRIDELQRKLNVQVSCDGLTPPTTSSIAEWSSSSYGIDPEAHRRFWQLMNDVIAAAFACDTCRVVTMRVTDIFSGFEGDWHQEVAHEAHFPEGAKQAIITAAHQRFFRDVFLDLVAKLDAIDEGEGTVLDHSLVQWTQESGAVTHDPIELPVVTAGSAVGHFATGRYVDYRNLGSVGHTPNETNAVTSHTGLIYNQWLGMVLRSMGLSEGDYEDGSYGGYGLVQLATESWYAGYQKYGPSVLSAMGQDLPFLRV